MKHTTLSKLFAMVAVVAMISMASVQSNVERTVRVQQAHKCQCQLGQHMPLSQLFKQSSVVVLATVSADPQGDLVVSAIQELKGEITTNSVIRNHMSHQPAGSGRNLLFLNEEDDGYHCLAAFIFGAELEVEVTTILRQVAAQTQNPGPEAKKTLGQSCANFIRQHSLSERQLSHALTLELAQDAQMVAALPEAERKQLRQQLMSSTTADVEGFSELLAVYAEIDFDDSELWQHLLDLPRFDRIRTQIVRILRAKAANNLILELQQRIQNSDDSDKRWQAAWLLARSQSESRSWFATPVQNSNADLEAESLIALAGSDDEQRRNQSLDILRKQMLRGRTWQTDSELGQQLAEKRINDVRFGELRGEERQLFAAAYYIARSPDTQSRLWLKGRIKALRDPALVRFCQALFNQNWIDFDASW